MEITWEIEGLEKPLFCHLKVKNTRESGRKKNQGKKEKQKEKNLCQTDRWMEYRVPTLHPPKVTPGGQIFDQAK